MKTLHGEFLFVLLLFCSPEICYIYYLIYSCCYYYTFSSHIFSFFFLSFFVGWGGGVLFLNHSVSLDVAS